MAQTAAEHAARKDDVLFIEAVELRRDGPFAVSVVGVFEGLEAGVVLARIGEGPGDPRAEEGIEKAAEAVARLLFEGHDRAWRRAAGVEGRRGHAGIDYDEADPDARTSYRGVTLTVRSGVADDEAWGVERFHTGDPVADWAAMQRRARRVCGGLLVSSSVDAFVHDVVGFRFDRSDDLALDPEDTPEKCLERRRGDDPED